MNTDNTSKIKHATNQINTSLVIKQKDLEKPVLIGGVYYHTVMTDENDNVVEATESSSAMSVKLNR